MGAVRLVSVLIAALTMDLAGRKVLLYVSGECPHCDVCLLLLQPVCGLESSGHTQASLAHGPGPSEWQLLQTDLLELQEQRRPPP